MNPAWLWPQSAFYDSRQRFTPKPSPLRWMIWFWDSIQLRRDKPPDLKLTLAVLASLAIYNAGPFAFAALSLTGPRREYLWNGELVPQH